MLTNSCIVSTNCTVANVDKFEVLHIAVFLKRRNVIEVAGL